MIFKWLFSKFFFEKNQPYNDKTDIIIMSQSWFFEVFQLEYGDVLTNLSAFCCLCVRQTGFQSFRRRSLDSLCDESDNTP
jgi:hypothetical protein